FSAVVAHEFSEVMGRLLLVGGRIGTTNHSYMPLDLFHYASAGVRTFSGTHAGYFSVDGGVIHLENFNTNPAGDFGDWSSANGPDAFNAFADTGVVENVSAADLTALDVIGWNRATTTATAATTTSTAAGGAAGGNLHG